VRNVNETGKSETNSCACFCFLFFLMLDCVFPQQPMPTEVSPVVRPSCAEGIRPRTSPRFRWRLRSSIPSQSLPRRRVFCLSTLKPNIVGTSPSSLSVASGILFASSSYFRFPRKAALRTFRIYSCLTRRMERFLLGGVTLETEALKSRSAIGMGGALEWDEHLVAWDGWCWEAERRQPSSKR